MPIQFPCVSNQVNISLDQQIVPMEKRTSEAQSTNLLPEWALRAGDTMLYHLILKFISGNDFPHR